VVWELLRGPIPEGLSVLHHCDNPPCVRPDHLYLGGHSENAQDMWNRGRQGGGRRGVTSETASRGDAHWTRKHPDRVTRGPQVNTAKLTEEQVREIRARHAAGEGLSALGRVYGVTPQSIYAIVNRKSWRHVE
jgi:hypothetical protein